MKKNIHLLIILFIAFGCTSTEQNKVQNDEINPQKIQATSTEKTMAEDPVMKEQIATFLTFQDYNAEEAMHFYISLFENSKVLEIERHGKDGPAKDGSILFAKFELNGSLFACSDSPAIHDWNFTPAVSNFVECKSEEEIQQLFTKLAENGEVMMPIDNYGWSTKFAFVADKYGVSWQLNFNDNSAQ